MIFFNTKRLYVSKKLLDTFPKASGAAYSSQLYREFPDVILSSGKFVLLGLNFNINY